jgi:hypothetical protein
MGKKSAPSAPPPIDPRAVAQADAEFNRINQVTPYGNLTYSDAPGSAPGTRNLATLELDPMIQRNLDAQMANDLALSRGGAQRLAGLDPNQIDLGMFGPIQSEIDTGFYDPSYLSNQQAGLNLGDALDLTQLPELRDLQDLQFEGFGPLADLADLPQLKDLPGLPTDMAGLRDEAESAFFNRGDRLLAPKYEQLETSLVDRLANQGLPQQDAAYTQELGNFYDERGRTYGDLANSAVLFGGQEATRELQNALGVFNAGLAENAQDAGYALSDRAQLADYGLGRAGLESQYDLGRAGLVGNYDLSRNNQLLGRRQLGLGEAEFGLGTFGEEAAFNNAVDLQRIGVEQQQLQNRNLARSQGLGEQSAIRGNAFNELASLLGLQQVQAPQLQSFYGPGQVDYLGAAGLSANQAMQQYQMDMQRANAGLGGLFSLGSSLLYGGGLAGGISNIFK